MADMEIRMGLIWIAAAVFFVILEAVTIGLTSIWFAGGAIVAAITAVFTDSIVIQATVFTLISIGMLVATRPFVRKHINSKVEKTNVDAIIGMTGIVVSAISPNESGAVRADGKVWTAVSDAYIAPGAEVKIKDIKGVTLHVTELE